LWEKKRMFRQPHKLQSWERHSNGSAKCSVITSSLWHMTTVCYLICCHLWLLHY